MRVPHARPGDVIDVVAPASACSPEALAAGVAVLEGWGFRPRVPPGLFERSGIVAAPDASRHRALGRALRSADSRVVWCVRGGYGSQRLLPRLAREAVPAPRKLLVGFSDLTALHVFINQHWGWPTLHAATLADLGSGRLSQRSLGELRRMVAGRTSRFSVRLRPLNPAARRARLVGGGLVGGNLKTIQALVGTPWSVRPAHTRSPTAAILRPSTYTPGAPSRRAATTETPLSMSIVACSSVSTIRRTPTFARCRSRRRYATSCPGPW